MAPSKTSELVGATQSEVRLLGNQAYVALTLDAAVQKKVMSSLVVASADTDPDRVFLNLENAKGLPDSIAFRVYITDPNSQDGFVRLRDSSDKMAR